MMWILYKLQLSSTQQIFISVTPAYLIDLSDRCEVKIGLFHDTGTKSIDHRSDYFYSQGKHLV